MYDITLGPRDAIEKYIKAVRLEGTRFEDDSRQVHTYIASFVAGNAKAEAAISKPREKNCGRADWEALKGVYQGHGAFRPEIIKAEKVVAGTFYSGDKSGHTWDKFEQEIVNAFHVLNTDAGPGVVRFSEVDMVKLLLKKTQSYAPLVATNAFITMELSNPVTEMTFQRALANMRQIVQQNKSNTSNSNSNARHIRAATTVNDRGGRGNNKRGNNGGRQGGNRKKKPRNHPEAYQITLKNGKRIMMHPSYYVEDDERAQMKDSDYQQILDARAAYKAQQRQVAAATTVTNPPVPAVPVIDAATIISALTQHVNGTGNANDNQSRAGDYTITISQANTQGGGTPFGGRNEEAS
ncbi:MAG: hypothetical protein ACRCT2_14145, partial [Plesiomonas shigelloides]